MTQFSTVRSSVGQRELPFLQAGGHVSISGVETYEAIRDKIRRSVELRSGKRVVSEVEAASVGQGDEDLHAAFDAAWLRTPATPSGDSNRGTVRIADIFSGCGALTLGISEACRALSLSAEHAFAADIDRTALKTYAQNFPGGHYYGDPVETLVGQVDSRLSSAERRLGKLLNQIDILAAGPPCQGHSDLNNYTRRSDPKNRLFSAVVRFAQVLQPKHIIIENVPGVRHDKGSVAAVSRRRLESLGYKVVDGVVVASELGVAQRRRRYIMIATNAVSVSLKNLSRVASERSLRWACEDLASVGSASMLDSHANSSAENRNRIQYLFDNNLYDLPDQFRPPCHRDKKHTYRSVYGRLRWDEPAPTVTSGFNSPGQGRFVHPDRPRTLTPHEAARIQFLPDFFRWGAAKRESLTQMIGNAVPPKLGYSVALELLR